MNMNPPAQRASRPARRSTLTAAATLGSSVSITLAALRDVEPVGLESAGINTQAILLALLSDSDAADPFTSDATIALPEAAKRKVDEDEEDEDDDDDEKDDAVEEDDAEEEDAEEDEDEEEDDDDEEEDEEDDDFDDAEDDDFDDDDDDDDEDDFGDDE